MNSNNNITNNTSGSAQITSVAVNPTWNHHGTIRVQDASFYNSIIFDNLFSKIENPSIVESLYSFMNDMQHWRRLNFEKISSPYKHILFKTIASYVNNKDQEKYGTITSIRTHSSDLEDTFDLYQKLKDFMEQNEIKYLSDVTDDIILLLKLTILQ